ncbi:MAG: B12-binding domain-containing radical SAM protein [Bryobacterales bacterium]|nr:B12-binding domain-containing radical SAM protein [Bryobacterales bacterium]
MKVLLLNPPSPERLASPLLGMQYVTSSLLAQGCEVKVIDAAARSFPHPAEWIAQEARDFAPQVIGVGLFTRWVHHAYRLVEQLQGDWLLVAGGPHTTVRAEETLRLGFDVALTGEAEQSMRRLIRWRDGRDDIGSIPGVVFRRHDGGVGYGPPAEFTDDLDALPPPHAAQHLFDAQWYGDNAAPVPGGVLTSRGCPARCTFCANHVTGRRFRHRSAQNVVAELNTWNRLSGLTHFPFWDDAFTAEPARIEELCQALENGLQFPLTFGVITRANMITPRLLRIMRRTGLIHVNFGVESGDDAVLRAIRKGVRTEQVVGALEWAKEAGLLTACNFMLGFPQETEAELDRTLRFMERIAPLVDAFSTMGVVVPFPGTPLYDDYHFQYGFTDWWLKPGYSRYTAPPRLEDTDRYYRYYIDDANLDLDFFRYTNPVKAMIRECLRYKAEHNLRRMRAA